MSSKIFVSFILISFILCSPLLSSAEKMFVGVEDEAPVLNSDEDSSERLNNMMARRAFWDQETKVVGIGLGFGLGHLMAGEYKNRGWFYTAAELAALAAFGYGVSSYFGDISISSFGKAVGSFLTLNEAVPNQPVSSLSSLTMVAGLVGFLAVKLVEGFEVWHKPRVVIIPPAKKSKG